MIEFFISVRVEIKGVEWEGKIRMRMQNKYIKEDAILRDDIDLIKSL